MQRISQDLAPASPVSFFLAEADVFASSLLLATFFCRYSLSEARPSKVNSAKCFTASPSQEPVTIKTDDADEVRGPALDDG
ncbi:hypothetical protein SUNI508_02203 [Seiridium unicorne]|uniref:Uncharacterized protein n=1 Tax=Seiridium unicorne TaxID=138068 RepID=A0ABR2UIB0_9PEZI